MNATKPHRQPGGGGGLYTSKRLILKYIRNAWVCGNSDTDRLLYPLLISALRKGRKIYFTNLAAKNLNITLAENFEC